MVDETDATEQTVPKKKKRSIDGSRTRNKKIVITGPSVKVNGKNYGASAMITAYDSTMSTPDKEKVQAICADAYMQLVKLFTTEQ